MILNGEDQFSEVGTGVRARAEYFLLGSKHFLKQTFLMIKTTSSSSSAASSIDLIDAGIREFSNHARVDYTRRESINFLYFKDAQLFKEINKNSHTNDGIADDLIDDAFDLTNDKSNGDVLYYASTPMTSASLISFNKGGKDGETDDFLQMLADSYRGTNRNISVGGRSVSTKTVATPTTINLKLTFISTEGQGGSKSIEFSDENDYWTAISAIKRTSLGESCFASGKCQLSQGDASDITTTRSSFFSTGSKSPDCTFEIKNGKIKVMQKSTEVMSLDISNLKAMTLSADFDRSRTFILDIRLNPRSYVKNTHTEISMSVIDAEGKPLTSEYNNAITLSKLNKNDTVFVPVSEEDIQYSNLAFGASKVAIMNVDKLSGAERGIAAEVNIPFASFYFAQPGSARGGRPKISGGKLELITGEMITNAVTVRTPPNEREVSYRVVVKSASGLPLSGKKGPSAYCTIYLVNDKGEKLTTNTAESRTDVVAASCDPEWNKEFILKIDDKINVDFMYSGPLPSGVMLKIRDSASGILKHKHLGQVIIPISCFLMNTEASMCLPLDPTERMGDGQGTAGDIIFSTQLLGPKGVIPAVSPSGGDSASDYSARPKSSSIVSMTASNRRVSGAFGSRASVAMNHAPAKR